MFSVNYGIIDALLTFVSYDIKEHPVIIQFSLLVVMLTALQAP